VQKFAELKSQAEAEMFTQGLAECGLRRITVFTSGKEAYEVCARQQFPLFVTRVEMPDMSGLVVIQKLRATGNYGLEPNLYSTLLAKRWLQIMKGI
jgi:CheY-like chemotaxis protein